jgi:hypothetical protein
MSSPESQRSSNVRVPGSAVHYGWNGQGWDSPIIEAYTYDNQARITSQADTDSLSRMPQSNFVYIYDGAGNLLEALVRNWNGVRLEDVARETMTYDTHNNVTQELVQMYTQGSWVTVKGTRYQYAYNPAGHMVSKVKLGLDFANNYVNRERHLFTVPTSGEWTAETIQSWTNNAWSDSLRTTMAVWHNFAKTQMQSANIEARLGPIWVPFRFVGTFSPVLDRRTLQMRRGGSFVNQFSMVKEFDAAGNMTSFREEEWEPGTSTWDTQLESRYLYTYNAAGDMVRRIGQFNEVGVTNGLQNISRDNYKNFQTITLAAQTPRLPAESLRAYPNPSPDGRFRVQTNLPGAVQLRLTDALGRSVLKRDFPSGLSSAVDLDLSQQPKGVYSLELSSGLGVARHKLVVN